MSEKEAIETAWRIHAALADWTGKVDAKATFALTIESAVLAGVVALAGSDTRFGHLSGFLVVSLFWLGVTLIAGSVVLSVLVVAPRTRKRFLVSEWTENFIYFGHLQFWDPEDLATKLLHSDPLPVLTRQLVVMSKISWTKHRRVQQSLITAVCGAACILLAGMFA